MSKLKFSIYGNCQIGALRKILLYSAEFSAIYKEVQIRPFHLKDKNEEAGVPKILKNVDLFIYQPILPQFQRGIIPVYGTEYLLTLLKDNAMAISFPVAYFTGYNPESIIFRDNNGYVLLQEEGNFSAVHDLNILMAYHHGMSWQDCVSYIQKDNIYTPELIETNVTDSLGLLIEREKSIDVKISDFIIENWQKQRLFFDPNHCANFLILYEANQILHLLGLPSLNPAILTGCPEYLSIARPFVYPNVRKHFALSFAEEPIQYNNRTFTLDGAVRKYFDYYSTHPERVRFNTDFYSKSSNTPHSRIASYWTMPCSLEIQSKDAGISTLECNLREKDAQIRHLTLSSKEKARIIDDPHSELDMIRASISWKVRWMLPHIVLPFGTRRRYYYELGLRDIRIILKRRWHFFFRMARCWLQKRRNKL